MAVEDDELNGVSDGVKEGAKAQSQPDILKPMFGPKTNISLPQMENAQNYENYRNTSDLVNEILAKGAFVRPQDQIFN